MLPAPIRTLHTVAAHPERATDIPRAIEGALRREDSEKRKP